MKMEPLPYNVIVRKGRYFVTMRFPNLSDTLGRPFLVFSDSFENERSVSECRLQPSHSEEINKCLAHRQLRGMNAILHGFKAKIQTKQK